MTRILTTLGQRVRSGALLTALPAILLAGSINPAWAKKGGNGGGGNGGGGGEEPPAVELVSPPVEYEITIPALNTNVTDFRLFDVNSFGDAVGYLIPADTGAFTAIMASSDGSLVDLNDLFADSLANDFPGWRFAHALQICSSGLIAGGLVPVGQLTPYEWDSDGTLENLIVVGNIYAASPALTQVAWFGDDRAVGVLGGQMITDMNEAGDIVVEVYSENPIRYHEVYLAPHNGSSTVHVVRQTDRADGGPVSSMASINAQRQIAYGRGGISTGRGRNAISIPQRLFVDHLGGGLQNLGETVYVDHHIAESGAIYAGDGGSSSVPARLDPGTGTWGSIAPVGSRIVGYSKATFGEEILLKSPTNGPGQSLVYQDGLGTFALEVTSGTPADFYLWHDTGTSLASGRAGVSRPADSGSGYLCGYLRNNGFEYAFILTPTPVAQP